MYFQNLITLDKVMISRIENVNYFELWVYLALLIEEFLIEIPTKSENTNF